MSSNSTAIRVAVTRTAGKAEQLATRLRTAGAHVHEVSLYTVVPRPSPALDAALSRLGDTRWIVLTSEHAVALLADAVRRTGTDTAVADRCFAMVGESTAAAARAHGWQADMVPAQRTAAALVDAMASRTDVTGTRALYLAEAELDHDLLPPGLRALGVDVTTLPSFATAPDPEVRTFLLRLLAAGELDLVTVAAPSAVDALAEVLPPEHAGRIALASIGPVTSKAARQAGFVVAVEADPYTSEGLVRAIVDWRARSA